MHPIRDLTRGVTTPITAIAVVGLCWLIDTMTSPHHTWWPWVALGMGIATAVAVLRALRTAAVLLLAWWVGRALLRRHGPQARAVFDAWVARERPAWADVAAAWHTPPRGGDSAGGPGVVRH